METRKTRLIIRQESKRRRDSLGDSDGVGPGCTANAIISPPSDCQLMNINVRLICIMSSYCSGIEITRVPSLIRLQQCVVKIIWIQRKWYKKQLFPRSEKFFKLICSHSECIIPIICDYRRFFPSNKYLTKFRSANWKDGKFSFPCAFRYKLFNIDVLNNITPATESEEKFEDHYRLCSFRCSAFNQAPLSRQLTGRSMQLKAIVTSVCVREY